jgi:hypothetical protein
MSNHADPNTRILLDTLQQRQKARHTVAEYAEILDSVMSALNEKRGLWFDRLESRRRPSLTQALNHLPSRDDIHAMLTELEAGEREGCRSAGAPTVKPARTGAILAAALPTPPGGRRPAAAGQASWRGGGALPPPRGGW